jgi:2-polyprenyl-6-methoxyphenol hydroxylase-like FAD-dependent oxidoreductase
VIVQCIDLGLEVGVRYDIVIVGAGPAGLSFACLASEHGLKIALIDQQGEELLAAPPSDGRDIALTHRSIQILKNTGAWSNIAVEEGKTYKWRRCRRSRSQPFCDESHAGTGIEPVMFTTKKTETVIFCGCKETGDAPFCNGTHNVL